MSNRIKHISKERINKRLCIDCDFCRHRFPTDTYWCGLHRSKVDDSPIYTAEAARDSKFVCGGRHWEKSSDIIVHPTKEEALNAEREDSINSFMKTARAIVEEGVRPLISCGYLDLAIERVKKEKGL